MIELTNIEQTWEELHHIGQYPVNIFGNQYLPDGVTSTAPIFDAYTAAVNTPESTAVNL